MAYRATAFTEIRKSETRECILDAAKQLIAEGGFTALSMAAVAATANISTGNLYRYFRNKAALCVAVFEQVTQREIDAVFNHLDDNDSAAQQLQQGLSLFAQRALTNPKLTYALIAEPVGPAIDETRLSYRGQWTGKFAAIIAAGIANKEFIEQPAELAAAAIVGAMAEAVHHQTEVFCMTPAHIAPLVDFCLRGLQHRGPKK